MRKLQLAYDAANEILGTDERILSVQSSYSDGESFSYMIASNGFEGESSVSYYSLSVSVSVKGEGESRPESYWYDQALSYDDLKKEGIGKIALERTLHKLGQEKIGSGRLQHGGGQFEQWSSAFAPFIGAEWLCPAAEEFLFT